MTRGFAEPISAPETLHRYTEMLSQELATLLEDKVSGASQLDLLFFRIDSRIETIRAGLAQATREAILRAATKVFAAHGFDGDVHAAPSGHHDYRQSRIDCANARKQLHAFAAGGCVTSVVKIDQNQIQLLSLDHF